VPGAKYLGIRQWLLFRRLLGQHAGGWAYGQTVATAAASVFILARRVSSAARVKSNGFFSGPRHIYPESLAPIRRDAARARARAMCWRGYVRRLFDPDPRVHLPFAAGLERVRRQLLDAGSQPGSDPSVSRTMRWRWRGWRRISSRTIASSPRINCCRNMYRIRHLPASIIHARYDHGLPDHQRRRPGACLGQGCRYIVVPEAGHSVWEPPVRACGCERGSSSSNAACPSRAATAPRPARRLATRLTLRNPVEFRSANGGPWRWCWPAAPDLEPRAGRAAVRLRTATNVEQLKLVAWPAVGLSEAPRRFRPGCCEPRSMCSEPSAALTYAPRDGMRGGGSAAAFGFVHAK